MDTKQKAREMFDEEFVKDTIMTNVRLVERQNPDNILNFIDQIIDLAIAERNREIVKMIKETQKTIRLEQFTVDTIINLINNQNK